ncbi:MAG TPA: hypothetical protein VFS05_14105 [Gemmatimonadaceae bacterium]|nr:hypothetical protein [Gemmatimonadaceae bacterium]
MPARGSATRGFLSVITGFLIVGTITTVLELGLGHALGRAWGQPTLSYFIAVVGPASLAGIGGGYTTGRLARHHPVWHAAALALLLLVAGTAIAAREPVVGEPEWYHPVSIGGAMLGSIAGGWIARARSAFA